MRVVYRVTPQWSRHSNFYNTLFLSGICLNHGNCTELWLLITMRSTLWKILVLHSDINPMPTSQSIILFIVRYFANNLIEVTILIGISEQLHTLYRYSTRLIILYVIILKRSGCRMLWLMIDWNKALHYRYIYFSFF